MKLSLAPFRWRVAAGLQRITYLAIAALAFGLCAGVIAAPRPNKDCLDCHEDKELTKTNAAGKAISLFVDEKILARSAHQTNWCVSCHSDITEKHPDDEVAAKPVRCDACHAAQSASYGTSAHGVALKAGKEGTAVCTDCHGTHNISRPTMLESPLHWSKLTQTCGECHPEIAAEVKDSVHGRSVAKGSREAATCTDCHSEHNIHSLKGKEGQDLSGDVCAKCHASESINSKFRMPANRVKTFYESYHGLAVQGGSTRAANCASCHGFHMILPSTDPRSTIHTNHLVETCGKCHPGATDKFASGKIHLDTDTDSDFAGMVNHWVRRIYLGLIFGIVGIMLVHNGLALVRKLVAMKFSNAPTIERMDANQRWQHGLLMFSFIILAISGFALKFPDSFIAWLFGSDEEIRRWVHRIAGVVLLVVGLWHIVYVMADAKGRQLVKDLLFRKQDIMDCFAAAHHFLTGKGSAPKFARFGYIEKMEYWAVIWGTIIMGLTGLAIWLKMDVTRWLPRWVVEVSITIHYYEAILACLAIGVWHIYHVIFHPDIYPMNTAWLNGKVSLDYYRKHHALDTNALGESAKVANSAAQSAKDAKK